MEQYPVVIDGIPAVLWGPPAPSLFLAVHGDQSNKSDTVIAILAEEAVERGHRVLSFDLPGHGDRGADPGRCGPQSAAADIALVLAHARTLSTEIRLFGNSLGAYFGMHALRHAQIRQALFLSPVVDMRRLIESMMAWFDVGAERLKREQAVETPMKTLYWEDYRYVVMHPVRWNKPTALLYGSRDTLIAYDDVAAFAARTGADLQVLEGSEHFFHTAEQLDAYRRWLRAHIAPGRP